MATPLALFHAVPSATIEPRQSTTVPKVSNTSAFTDDVEAAFASCAGSSRANPNPHTAPRTCRRLISGLIGGLITVLMRDSLHPMNPPWIEAAHLLRSN